MKEYTYQILNLTDKFYKNYSSEQYHELLQKNKRAYNCLLIETHYDYYICIPFRTEITHKFAYKFKDSVRSKEHNSGLDYTKMIIVNNPEYLSSKEAVVDRDEYIEVVKNIDEIVEQVLDYLEEYINWFHDKSELSKKKYVKRYKYSTLKYFHKELGIVSDQVSEE